MEKSYFSGFYSINESPNEIVLKRKWRGFLGYLIWLCVCAFFSIMCFEFEWYFWGLLTLLGDYLGLCGFLNVITIIINKEFIQVKQGFLPFFGNEKIEAKDVASISLVTEYSKTGKRLYSQSGGFHDEKTISGYDFIVYKKDNSRSSLLSFAYGDLEGAEFLKSKIEHFIPISNPINQPQ